MNTQKTPNKDLPGTILSIFFIGMGCLAWWDTFDMTDADSYVFPRAVIVILIFCCLLLIGRNMLWGGGKHHKSTVGSNGRRIGLVLAILGAALAMPVVGFIVSGMGLFGVLMILAMFEPWSRKNALTYPLIGIAIVLSFYVLFAMLLNVSLPIGSLFE